ncbi:MAG: RNA polymerase sigma factor [Actinomycetota bacterium]
MQAPAAADQPVDPPEEPPRFEAIFDAEAERLFRALYLMTGNRHEAEEVMQDAFIAVWERWDRVGAMASPTGYLYRTAMNRFRSRYRRASRAARRAVGLAEGRDEFALVDERDRVARALAELPPRQRAALVLTELLGYGSEAAAEVMGVAASTVRALATQGRESLRKTMEPDG